MSDTVPDWRDGCVELWVWPLPIASPPDCLEEVVRGFAKSGMTPRARRALRRLIQEGSWREKLFKGAKHWSDLNGLREIDLRGLKNCGKVTKDELLGYLAKNGVTVHWDR